jgi:hypothetical protein
MRSFLAVVAGLLVALVAQSAVGLLGNWIYPPPVSDMMDLRQVAAAIEMRPVGALWIDVLSYFVGGLAGGIVGKRVSGGAVAAWVPAVALAAMALAIAFNLPVPSWVMFATLAAPLAGGLIANHLVKGRAPAAISTPADLM